MQWKTITADALLTERELARYRVEERRAHYHFTIDWNDDEDRSRISKGHDPENMTRLRRFAVSVIKSKRVRSVAQKMRELTLNTRRVFDYLKMTRNSCQPSAV